MNKVKNVVKIILLIMLGYFISGILVLGTIYLISVNADVEINTDINKYNEYIDPNAKDEYRDKWGMDESIFPRIITANMNVIDYKMVYYDPWDAQYLSYLVVKYNEEDFQEEINRLKGYGSTEYLGYYSVTGFSKYDLLAMNADSYQGFVYAITDNENKIIYVELIFCNYFYDLDYKNYINEDYLPDGFDATLNNAYAEKELTK